MILEHRVQLFFIPGQLRQNIAKEKRPKLCDDFCFQYISYRPLPTGEVGDVASPVVAGQQPALEAGLGPEGPGLAVRAGGDGKLLLVRHGYLMLQAAKQDSHLSTLSTDSSRSP